MQEDGYMTWGDIAGAMASEERYAASQARAMERNRVIRLRGETRSVKQQMLDSSRRGREFLYAKRRAEKALKASQMSETAAQ